MCSSIPLGGRGGILHPFQKLSWSTIGGPGGGEVPRDRNVLLQNRLQDRGAGFPRKSTTSKDISIFCVWRKVHCIKKYGRISNRIKKGKRVAEEVTFISK